MRVNVYVPDELGERVKKKLPDVNVSAIVQEALRSLLDCEHERLACVDCGDTVDAQVGAGEALSAFYSELMWAWEPLVDRGGTAEGAARIAKAVAVAMDVPRAQTLPLPRPTRAARKAS